MKHRIISITSFFFGVFFKTITFILFFSFKCTVSISQDSYYLKTYTTDNGLPHNNVTGIIRDQTGFIWIATWDGLSRFDGYTFRNYYHIPDDSSSIPNFIVHEIFADRKNRLWILTNANRIAYYNREKDNFTSCSLPGNEGMVYAKFYSFMHDPSGNLWILTGKKIFRFSYDQNSFVECEFTREDQQNMQPDDQSLLGSIDNNGNVWLYGSDDRLIRCSIEKDNAGRRIRLIVSGEFRMPQVPHAINSLYRTYRNLLEFFVSSENSTWLLTHAGIFKLDTIQNVFRSYPGPVSAIGFYGKPCFHWESDETGLNVFFTASKELITISSDVAPSPHIVYSDNPGSVWFDRITPEGSGIGLGHYIRTPSYFNNQLIRREGSGDPLAVYAVIKDKNDDVWIGVRDLNHLIRIKPDGKREKCNVLDDLKWMKSGHVRSLLEDKEGIWIGYYMDLLMYYNFSNGRFISKIDNTAKKDPGLIRSFRVLRLYAGGQVLLSSPGLHLFDPSTGRISPATEPQEIPVVYAVTKDSTRYWIGLNESNIKCVNAQLKEFFSLTLCQNAYNVEDICPGDGSEVWIALLGGGICRFDTISREKEFFTTFHGLSNNTTYSILKDREGDLWISTDKGLSKFSSATRKFRKFGLSDGLKIEEFNSDAAFLAPDGEMFFGGVGGIVSFYPEKIIHEETSEGLYAPLLITDFKVSGQNRYADKPVYELERIKIAKGEDNFQVDFASLNYTDADKIKYRYRLIGYNEKWTDTDYLHRFVNFANIPPGEYELEIEATDKTGEWKDNLKLIIVIPALYYQTLWFKLIIVFLFLCIIAVIMYMNNRQLKLKTKQELDHLRLESLRGQMNPHFIFNSLNSINYFISNNDRLSANRYIADFSKLIRSVIGNLSVEYSGLNDEIESLKEYLDLEHLRFGDKFDYALRIDGNIEPKTIKVFPGLIQPFVENAIWHGVRGLENRKGFILVEFVMNESGILQCVVQDDGIGRTLSAERKSKLQNHRSRGISIVRERLKIINGLRKKNYTVLFEDLQADLRETGTRVIVDIPVQ